MIDGMPASDRASGAVPPSYLAASLALLLLAGFALSARAAEDKNGKSEQEADGSRDLLESAGTEGRYVVIHAGRVITVSGQTYEPGTVVIEGGKIRLVGQKLEYPKTAKVIQAAGQTVMPGLILTRTRYRLPRYSRSGIHGSLSAADEIYLADIDFADFLREGFTTVAFIPAGADFPGAASAYSTAGDGERLRQKRAYFPVSMRDKGALEKALKKARAEIKKVEEARAKWEKKQKQNQGQAKGKKPKPEKEPEKKKPPPAGEGALKSPPKKPPPKKSDPKKSAAKKFTPPKIDPNVQPLVDLLQKKAGPGLVFEFQRASDIHHLDDVLEQFPEIKGLYYLRRRYRSDYHYVVEHLGEREAFVVMQPEIGRLPFTANRYNLASALARAGCTLAFLPRSDNVAEYRNLRPSVADVVRAGLTRKTALQAITVNAARVLRLDDRLGTIEKGKLADLIFLSDDPFVPESRVRRVMVNGEVVWRGES